MLPQGYYALGEQRSGDIGPDVLTLHSDTFGEGWQLGPAAGESGMIAVAERPPQVRLTAEAESEAAFYITKRRTLAIHHASDDRIVALIEIQRPARKHLHGRLARRSGTLAEGDRIGDV